MKKAPSVQRSANARRTLPLIAGLVVAGLAVNVYFLYRLSAQNPVERMVQEHPFLSPTQSFYNDADLLVNMRPLRDQLTTLVGSSTVSIYFEYLNTGANVSVNGNLPFFPGSLMKIPVAMAVMKNVDSGQWSLDDELILTDADKNPDYGTMYQLPSGTHFTIRELLEKLLVDSDDTARQIFIRNLGEAKINDVLNYLGLQDIFNQNLQISAQRYSNFFRSLYSASYLSANSSEELLKIMAEPHDMKLLRQGLPAQIEFSHKIGVYDIAYSDAGIIYVPHRPYILTVMVQASSSDAAAALMAPISQAIYTYVTR